MAPVERIIETNGIRLRAMVEGTGPLVLMVHGFPESWYSWRWQIGPIAAAGFTACAIDVRGYGGSDKPRPVEAYAMDALVADIAGVIQAFGEGPAVLIGHDWGAPTAWAAALHHPSVVRAVGALSVPFLPRSPVPPMAMLRAIFAGQFFYQLYFFEPGVAEAEFEADIRTALRKFLVMAGGETDLTKLPPKKESDDLLSNLPDPKTLPAWLSEADLDFYAAEFTRSGMRGPLNYYRNHDLTWELTKDGPTTIAQPAFFIGGANDGVIMMAAEALKAMPNYVTDLRINKLIPAIGHWTQQEAPDAVNETICAFLKDLDG